MTLNDQIHQSPFPASSFPITKLVGDPWHGGCVPRGFFSPPVPQLINPAPLGDSSPPPLFVILTCMPPNPHLPLWAHLDYPKPWTHILALLLPLNPTIFFPQKSPFFLFLLGSLQPPLCNPHSLPFSDVNRTPFHYTLYQPSFWVFFSVDWTVFLFSLLELEFFSPL